MCPADHWCGNDKNGRDRVKTSSLSRVLRKPNDYQTWSDFISNAVRYMYLQGNGYALAVRNERFEIDELHLMNPMMSWPQMATTGDVFYRLAGNHVIGYRLGGTAGSAGEPILVPQRDVLHLRLQASQSRWPYPLIGETPLASAMAEVYTQEAILNQQAGFYRNQARPSAVLSTDLTLDKDQVQHLRDRWNEQAKALQAGGTPILTSGLKVQPWNVSGKDAQIAEMLKMTEERIALAFRVPMQILGIGTGPYSATEVLMQSWLASGLGFCLNHIEEAIGLLFGLKGRPVEYVAFDTHALLRSAMKDRLEALARGVQGGIYSPNEARGLEGLAEVQYGDEPRVQQQVVPLSAAEAIPAAPASPGAPSQPAAAKPDQPPKPKPDDLQRQHRFIEAAAARHARRAIAP
jgi:HK97 family phage portal protein